MTAHINAPFTDQQVADLTAWQESPHIHPYTCPNRSEAGHETSDRDHGMLEVTVDGLHCPACGRLQTWAHDPGTSNNPETSNNPFNFEAADIGE